MHLASLIIYGVATHHTPQSHVRPVIIQLWRTKAERMVIFGFLAVLQFKGNWGVTVILSLALRIRYYGFFNLLLSCSKHGYSYWTPRLRTLRMSYEHFGFNRSRIFRSKSQQSLKMFGSIMIANTLLSLEFVVVFIVNKHLERRPGPCFACLMCIACIVKPFGTCCPV